MEDLVHAQMILESATYGKILKNFYVANCNASSVYGTCKGWSIKAQLFFKT